MKTRLPLLKVCFAVSVVVALTLLPSAASAACRRCFGTTVFVPMYSCVPVEDGETGATECKTFPLLGGTGCLERGTFCSVITVGGGGGGGQPGGGGGSTCSYDDSGYCAPWCSACNQTGG